LLGPRATSIVSWSPKAADQISSGLSSDAAIGAGVSGSAVLAALLLLLFLKKRRQIENSNEPDEAVGEVTTQNFTDEDGYINEYGLSDGCGSVDGGEDEEDLPRVVSEAGEYNSDLGIASEHNPEDIDECLVDADES
jgi:hypothetical protein